jgi:hypothetical protein
MALSAEAVEHLSCVQTAQYIVKIQAEIALTAHSYTIIENHSLTPNM